MREPFLSDIQELLLTQASDWREQLDDAMKAANVSTAQMVDVGVAALARRIGAQWVDNVVGFSEVSIACARLQTILREFAFYPPPSSISSEASDVAVVVRGGEQHILGASVLTAHLRKIGVSVRLVIGMDDKAVARELGTHTLDAILISSALSDALEELSDFVKICRNATGGDVPIVVGGPVIELAPNVAYVTGADLATSDLEEVLRKCKLTAPLPRAGPAMGA